MPIIPKPHDQVNTPSWQRKGKSAAPLAFEPPYARLTPPATPGGLPSGERRNPPRLDPELEGVVEFVDLVGDLGGDGDAAERTGTAQVSAPYLDRSENLRPRPESLGLSLNLPIKGPVPTDEELARYTRIERFALKAIAEKALGVNDQGKALYRCHRYRIGSHVELKHDPAAKSASFAQVETCHGVWTCAACSPKISERRRLELVEAVKVHRGNGGSVLFLTLTFPHGIEDVLDDILDRFLAAIRWMTAHRSYKALKALHGILGYVRALEPTHGRNGWHPHAHSLLFLERELDQEAFIHLYGQLYVIWAQACARMGFPPPKLGVGVNLKYATATTEEVVAEYVAKYGYQPKKPKRWTATHELTKAITKTGKYHGKTPWDLLRSNLVEHNPRDLELFAEYAQAFKGKRQLTWSKGLRAKLGLGAEEPDEALSQADEPYLLAQFDPPTWRKVVKAKAWPHVLEAGSSGDEAKVWAIIEALPEPPPRTPFFTPSD